MLIKEHPQVQCLCQDGEESWRGRASELRSKDSFCQPHRNFAVKWLFWVVWSWSRGPSVLPPQPGKGCGSGPVALSHGAHRTPSFLSASSPLALVPPGSLHLRYIFAWPLLSFLLHLMCLHNDFSLASHLVSPSILLKIFLQVTESTGTQPISPGHPRLQLKGTLPCTS